MEIRKFRTNKFLNIPKGCDLNPNQIEILQNL